MTRTRRRWISSAARAALVAFAACNVADGSTSTTESPSDVPGVGLSAKMYPLMNPSLTPLAPVNSVTKAIFARACVSKPDGSAPDVGEFAKQDAASVAYVKYAKSRSQVDDALAVKVAASFAGPTAGVSAEVEASTESSTRAESALGKQVTQARSNLTYSPLQKAWKKKAGAHKTWPTLPGCR